MKLLLTSAGLVSPAICQALADLTGKPLSETNILINITASLEDTDYGKWLIKDLERVKRQEFRHIDVIDFAALPRERWLPRFEAADILYFTGGNPYHLLERLQDSGLDKLLPELLESRVYVGKSAGSSIAGKSLLYSSPREYVPDSLGPQPIKALGLTDFCVRSHLNSPDYPAAVETAFHKKFEESGLPVYAIGDHTALKIDGDKVDVVGEGEVLKLG